VEEKTENFCQIRLNVRSLAHAQKVTIKTLPNSMVTLAAVDNGVLRFRFETPDPYNYFYAGAEVNAFDIYPYSRK
jgi:uncharacterized protein YfaS (alpha-2-macroglobulin family)